MLGTEVGDIYWREEFAFKNIALAGRDFVGVWPNDIGALKIYRVVLLTANRRCRN